MSHGGVIGLYDMLIIAGHLIVAASDRDSYVADCAAAVVAARGAEGCLDFAVSADAVDPQRVNVFERWRTRESLAAFRGDGPEGDIASRILEINVEEYEVV
jgi:heme-degrading monooxygenase HmoA